MAATHALREIKIPLSSQGNANESKVIFLLAFHFLFRLILMTGELVIIKTQETERSNVKEGRVYS